ncbi:hypothetical protein RL74_13165 [Pseudomonas fluorescens]|uniref:Uncharacterized protein n=1 Tax=Pseudomonas fluorescens TaxID=294 RepID=A0A0D0P9A6_PSEFL|nr:hypothetical protein [Pseudomonas fluorescens]KIQ58929.1 hypothetical protein RL74_13165 [Pseudomonas fluorescens]
MSSYIRTRPAMASKRLDLPSVCDICGFARSTRRHQTCSKLRQQRKSEEWAALMAEKLVARAAREKRYSR